MKKLFSTIVMFVVLVMASGVAVYACIEDQLYPHPSDCTKFYRCSNGMLYELECPPGLHFNPAMQVCDWPQDAGCEADGGGSKQCYKNPNDGKNDGNCYLRQDSNGSGAYIQVCEQARYQPNPCETGASM
ncbi:carbohydrate-binding module family 14 protein [Chitinophaga varians]|uniref:carbohydrate-binding module family 14 protein n=1 Tax=Chitinophaga varians TaxID=2202339 RepID=UPI00165EEDBB|nr:carbohydrate-binding module family 14 protein [Chitinophaga varians]MBC9911129.1 chitin binding domain-containing protein [Chitinophaga varians]